MMFFENFLFQSLIRQAIPYLKFTQNYEINIKLKNIYKISILR